MIIPAGHRVLIKPDNPEETDEVYRKAQSFGLILQEDQMKKEKAASTTGVVVSIGSTAWVDYGGEPWAKVSDRVHYVKYSGVFVKDDDGVDYAIVNDIDVLGIVTEEV